MIEVPLRIVSEPPEGHRVPGTMWRYPPGDEPGRECWWIVLPNTRGDGLEISWRTTDRASSPPHEMWDVTGIAPHLTVSPSIDVEFWRNQDGAAVRDGSYWHGFIRDGVLIQALRRPHMLSVLIGIALVIVAVVLWMAGITIAHALAILIGLVGLLVLLYGFGDRVKYTRL